MYKFLNNNNNDDDCPLIKFGPHWIFESIFNFMNNNNNTLGTQI